MKLNHHIKHIKGIGEVMQKKLGKLGIETVQDLLLHLPFRYDDFSKQKHIRELRDAEQVTISVTVEHIQNKRSSRKRMFITEAIVTDGDEKMQLVWFGQPFVGKTLKNGDPVYISGKVSAGPFGYSIKNPKFEKIIPGKKTTYTGKIVPIYPVTAGLAQNKLQKYIVSVLELTKDLPDFLPEDIKKKMGVIDLGQAVAWLHDPKSANELDQARTRMKFDELFLLQLRAEKIRQTLTKGVAPQIAFDKTLAKTFTKSLPFTLTKDQKISTWQILQDIQEPTPMNRLLEGDVGSGKTVVAAFVADQVANAGKQTVIMAPTEILAQQHYKELCALFGKQKKDARVIGLLTRSYADISLGELPETSLAGMRREVRKRIANGDIDVIVGTHALLTDDTMFDDLALVVIDEQHRFGVEQRKTLRNKSGKKETYPHFLSMTATPIPRSFALAMYGDLDLSIIKTMPPGRKPVITRLIEPNMRKTSYQFIKDQIKEGRQAFVICSMVDSDNAKEDSSQEGQAEKKAVMQEYKRLQKEVFPDLRVGFVHGKLKSKQKTVAMNDFAKQKTDILVSTSVIEVGVDIPNASVMIIEDADRFGLAQLHQFRGRVGRSSHQSYCFLFTNSRSQEVQKRLAFFEQHSDGFSVAEYDLEQRGPGEVYGKAQSGDMRFRFASLQDHDLIAKIQGIVKHISFEKYPTLETYIAEWEKDVHLE